MAWFGSDARAKRRERSLCDWVCTGPVLSFCTWVNGSLHPSMVAPSGLQFQAGSPMPTPTLAARASGQPFRALGCIVPVEAAAFSRPAEHRKSWEQSPGQPGQHLIRRLKAGRGHLRNNVVYFSIFKQV